MNNFIDRTVVCNLHVGENLPVSWRILYVDKNAIVI